MLLRNQLKFGIKNLKEVANEYVDDYIKPKHWYVLSLFKGVPRLYARWFKTEKDVKRYMKINKLNHITYTHIRGAKAIEFNLSFYKHTRGLYFLVGTKDHVMYGYPPDRISRQDKKSFRTKSRRWQRDFKTLPDNHTDFKPY